MVEVFNKKNVYDSHDVFADYQKQIVESGVYDGMPDLYKNDGGIQWETPSNRKSGKFKDSHIKRRRWWKNKAEEVGISTEENKWISKVAKTIHPTGKRPCKVCGTVLEIRYAYLSKNLIKRINKIDFIDPDLFELTEITHIIEFLSLFIDLYEDKALEEIPSLLECKQFKKIEITKHNQSRKEIIEWVDKMYISQEPSLLSPGSMSNPPDRLDGFHTYNRCCRSTSDKGRSKENLASYSTDRRAFENWSDGNWITANKLMGFISSDTRMNQLPCALNNQPGTHLIPCSADHIGPISLGFSHRPEFQLLCKSCNSGKNNRMSLDDALHLKKVESDGEEIITWYAKPVWDSLKNQVQTDSDAKKLSRIMRDNRHTALDLLYSFMDHGEYLFLYTFLNLDLCDFNYSINEPKINNNIVTTTFNKEPSNLKYVTIQKIRKIRVAFESLQAYVLKESRNSFKVTNTTITNLIEETKEILSKKESTLSEQNYKLKSILETTVVSDVDLQDFIKESNFLEIVDQTVFKEARDKLTQIMTEAALVFAENWNHERYTREYNQ